MLPSAGVKLVGHLFQMHTLVMKYVKNVFYFCELANRLNVKYLKADYLLFFTTKSIFNVQSKYLVFLHNKLPVVGIKDKI